MLLELKIAHLVQEVDVANEIICFKIEISEQMNQATSFLDGSTIYGSNAERTREIRSFVDGKSYTLKQNCLRVKFVLLIQS